MKKVHITGKDIDETILVSYEYVCKSDCEALGLKIGDDIRAYYLNMKDKLKFEPMVYYTTKYHPGEKLQHLIAKNPLLQELIEKYNLIPTV